jgi:hypothetical protein
VSGASATFPRGAARMALAGVLLAATPVPAQAGRSFSLLAEPGVSDYRSRFSDPQGLVTEHRAAIVSQRYRLSLDHEFVPVLRLSAGGLFEQQLPYDVTGPAGARETRATNLYANARFGGPVVGGSAGYTRREEASFFTTGRTSLVNETYGGHLSWQPAELPTVGLRLERSHQYDDLRLERDLVTDRVLLSATYKPSRQLDLRYSYAYANPFDRLTGLDAVEHRHSTRVAFADRFFEDRTVARLNYRLTRRSTAVASGSGTLLALQHPVEGLSLVESFSDVPAASTLQPNPALLDGDTAVGAGIDIGYGRTLAGDTALRDLGARFADAITEVNTVVVWTDRTLTQEVARAFQWSAWRSDDGFAWVQVPLAGIVRYGPFENRFEIPLAPTRASYVKVVVAPLRAGATLDPNLAVIQVTEIQLALAEPADSAVRRDMTLHSLVNGSARTRLLADHDLHHDASFDLARRHSPAGPMTWSLANGVGYGRRLGSFAAMSTRLARRDAESGRGHEGAFLYSASLSANPLPTLGHTLSYSGQRMSSAAGTSSSNAVNLFNRADLYPGIGVVGSLGYAFGTSAQRAHTESRLANLTATVAPHHALAVAATYGYSLTEISGGGRPETSSRGDRVEGTASLTPFPTLHLTAGLSRTWRSGEPPRTLANYSGSFSPFPGGSMQLHLSYSEMIDEAVAGRSRLFASGLRWNIRPGASFDVRYTASRGSSIAGTMDSTLLGAGLVVAL